VIRRHGRWVWVAGLALAVGACAPGIIKSGPDTAEPRLEKLTLRAADGVALPLQVWRPKGPVRAVVIGVHGMNDYANAFLEPGRYWSQHGVATYAFDQRGFGRAPGRGRWPGVARMQSDFRAAVAAVRKRHPGVRVVAVGASMGGGVVLSTMGRRDAPRIDGIVLVAPAVWSRSTMPRLYRATLNLAAHLVPWAHLSPQGLQRLPTDNFALMKRLSKDRLMLRGARIDSLWGVTNLMDAAAAAAPKVRVPTLLLYGERDEIIPRRPIRAVIERLPQKRTRVAVYKDGWHILLRDRQAKVVWDDILAWIGQPRAALPSGADKRAAQSILKRPRPKRPSWVRIKLTGG